MTSAEENGEALATLVASLADDAIDMLPKQVSEKLIPGGDIDPIVKGAFYDGEVFQYMLRESRLEALGIQAAYVVELVYGDPPPLNVVIPETIYYEQYAFQGAIKEEINELIAEADLNNSRNPSRDKYNLCLKILSNLWISNYRHNGFGSAAPLKEGTYLRDDEKNLYAFQEVER